MTHGTARQQGLEPVYPVGHDLSEVIFWDAAAGEYYNASCDVYLVDFDPVSQRSWGCYSKLTLD